MSIATRAGGRRFVSSGVSAPRHASRPRSAWGRRAARGFAAVCATCALAGLSAGCVTKSAISQEYLDPQTAVTIRAVATPMIYAHEVPQLAANVRDYLSVGAVEVNNMGKRQHYLAVVSWSTVDRKRASIAPPPLPEQLRMSLDGKPREWQPASHEPRSLGVGEPLFRPTGGYLGETWYVVTVAELRAFAAAPPDAVEVADEPANIITYSVWKNAGAELADFVRDIPDAIQAQQH
jgi:hypothetical protein